MDRNGMIEALKAKRFSDVFQYLSENQAKGKDSELKETFEILTKAQSNTFWDLLCINNKTVIERLDAALNSFKQGNTVPADSDVATLKCVLDSIVCYCQVSKYKPSSLFEILYSAQNILTATSDENSIMGLKVTIAKLYELWWLSNDEGAENLMPALLTHLMMSALSVGAYDADIKRLYMVRGGFHLLDFDAESFLFVRDLLQRCFVHPSFLKVKEGQKLLAFLLNTNEGALVETVVAVIKPQLAAGSKTVSAAYGKVFYHAWLESQGTAGEEDAEAEGGAATVVLEEAVQNLLRECIHASEEKYFKGVRFMLQAFHDVQRAKLDPMLLRVYDPILWRSLRCAHAQVRAQAAVVFLDVFPLQHADGRAEDNDKILQKQFDLLAALLKDTDHQVRAHAALGVCHILKEYWDSLPLNTTHNILKYLIDTLSVDASCANVRHAVFVGLGELFQQPLTHTLLKQLLPLLKNSIHDKAEKVRVAFMKILCQIKGIRGMHFYDIVPVDHLLERMAQDRHCPAVSRVMTELLLNSFYPQGESAAGPETEQLNRCMQFVTKNPVAAEVFYANLHHFTSIGHIAKLVTVLFTFLVTAEARHSRNNAADADVEETGAGGKRRRAPKMAPVPVAFAVKLGVMRVILKLLESVDADLAVQHPARELICKYLTETHARSLVAACTSADVSQAQHLLPVSFHLVAHAVRIRTMGGDKANKKGSAGGDLAALVSEVFCPAWSSVSESSAHAQQIRSVLAKSLVHIFQSLDQCATLLEVVSRTCEATWGPAITTKNAGKKAGKAVAVPELSIEAAVDLLLAFGHDVLASSACANVTAGIFGAARSATERLLDAGDADGSHSACLAATLNFWMGHCVHRDASQAVLRSDTETLPGMFTATAEMLTWASEKLLPAFSAAPEFELPQQMLSMVLAAIGDLLYLDLHDETLCSAVRDFLFEFHCRSKDMSDSATSPAIFAALRRMAGLLCKAQSGAGMEDFSLSLLDVLLQHVDRAEGTERDDSIKAVRSIVVGKDVSTGIVEHVLVLLIDEIEANAPVSKGSKSLVGAVRTATGSLLLGLVSGELRSLAHTLLSSWQAGAQSAPYSIRNPVAAVSLPVVTRLASHVEPVDTKPGTKATTLVDENNFDNATVLQSAPALVAI